MVVCGWEAGCSSVYILPYIVEAQALCSQARGMHRGTIDRADKSSILSCRLPNTTDLFEVSGSKPNTINILSLFEWRG